jgi:hypothetical protein
MAACPNCGGRVAQSARFCPRCGAPQKEGVRPSLQVFPPPAPAQGQSGRTTRERWDVCEIGWWHGYVKADFFALALGADQNDFEAARSPQFWWVRSDPPASDHDGAREAHEALVHKLLDNGWEPMGRGAVWYAQRFRRPAGSLRVLGADPQADTGSSHA